jgi:hypothetical protein
LDFVAVKTKFQHAINDSGATGKAKVICLRQLPGERINVVFASAADAKRARNHAGWLGTAMLNAKVLSEPWYPIKCDMAAKRAVSDDQTPDGRTLRQEVCAEFARDNAMAGLDSTVLKASWLSKRDPCEANGSMVVWLKNKVAADRLLQICQAVFGEGGSLWCLLFEECPGDLVQGLLRLQYVWTYAGPLQTRYSIWQLLRWPPNARLHGYCCAETPSMHESPHDQGLVL